MYIYGPSWQTIVLSVTSSFLHRWRGRRFLGNPKEFDPSTASGLTATNVLNAGRAFAISWRHCFVVSALPLSGAASSRC